MRAGGERAVAKRGLALPWVRSALPAIRRSRLHLLRVARMKSAKQRAGAPLSRLPASAAARASATYAAK